LKKLKKKWERPKLTVLIRPNSNEQVLSTCKTGTTWYYYAGGPEMAYCFSDIGFHDCNDIPCGQNWELCPDESWWCRFGPPCKDVSRS